MYFSGFASVMTEEGGWEVKAKCILLYEDLHVIAEQRELSQGNYLKQHILPKPKGPVLEGTRSLDSQNNLLSQRAIEKFGFWYM